MKSWRVLLAAAIAILFASLCMRQREAPHNFVLVGPGQVLKSKDRVFLFVQLYEHELRADPLASPSHVQVGEWRSIIRIDRTGAKVENLVQSDDKPTVSFNKNLGRFFGYQEDVYYLDCTSKLPTFYVLDQTALSLERLSQDREELLLKAIGLSSADRSDAFERLTELSRKSGWEEWLGEYRADSIRFEWEGAEYTIQSVGDAEHMKLVLHQESADNSKSVEILSGEVRDADAAVE